MSQSDLVSAWNAQPGIPFIPDYGIDVVLMGKRIEIGHLSSYSKGEILLALKQFIPSKHLVVLTSSNNGTPITIGTMSIQQLKDCVLWKPRVEPSAIIGTEFKAAFHSLYRQALSNDAQDATEALDMAQNLSFDCTLEAIAGNCIKNFMFYWDANISCNIFLMGNRKLFSLDTTRIRAMENRMRKNVQPTILSGPALPPKSKKSAMRRTKKQLSSSTSESESSSQSFSDSSLAIPVERKRAPVDLEEGEMSDSSDTPTFLASSPVPARADPDIELTLLPVTPPALGAPPILNFQQTHTLKKAQADLAVAQATIAALTFPGFPAQTAQAPAPALTTSLARAPVVSAIDQPILPLPPVALPPIPKKSRKHNKRASTDTKAKRHSKSARASRSKHGSRSTSHKKASKKARRAHSTESTIPSLSTSSSSSEDEDAAQVERVLVLLF